MLNLTLSQLEEVKHILSSQLDSSMKVFAFGSRTKGKANSFSDLDLVIKARQALTFTQLSLLKESFTDSDLPFCTDILDWESTSENFRRSIGSDLVAIIF